jgi:nucleoside-diphosphate-sugar epimerase
MKNVLVAGGGGFIGGWLVKELLLKGFQVFAIDIKPLSDWSTKNR